MSDAVADGRRVRSDAPTGDGGPGGDAGGGDPAEGADGEGAADGDPDGVATGTGGPGEGPSAATVTRRPTTLGTTLSILAALSVVAVTAPFAPSGAALAAVGTAGLALVAAVGGRRLVDASGLALLAATVATGAVGAAEPALFAAVGSVLAWDLAGNAVGVGEQLGREADTARAELAHAGATLAVGAVAAGVGYAVFETAGGGRPVTALVLMLVAAVVIVSALRV